MKLHLPRRRVWRVAIYIGSFLLVLIAADMVLVETRRTIHPGYDTTRIVAPLQPDGSIDYLLAVDNRFGEGITPENNAAVLMLQALGRGALAPKQPPNGVTEHLGMPPLPATGDYFVLLDDYVKQHAPPTRPVPDDLSHPHWPVEVEPVTAQWVKDSARPLALITEAVRRPRFFIPFYAGYRYDTMIEIALPHLNRMRDVGHALKARALMRLSADDIAGFRQDVLTSHRLARLLGQQPTIIERLVAIAVDTSTCEVERVGVSSGKIPGDQARAMAAELAALGDPPTFAECVDQGERFFALDTLQALARRGPYRAGELLNAITDRGPIAPPFVLRFVPIPYEATMRQVNHYEDGALAALREKSYPKRLAAIALWERQIASTDPASLSLWSLTDPQWPVQLFAPALVRVLQREHAAKMEHRLTQIALMLAAFKAEHGSYPASLAELSPAYLAEVPNDVFTEKPLIYSRTEKGYMLHSAGPNGVDDGGKGDDLVVKSF